MSGSGARPVGRGILIPKKTKITSDYRIQNSVLGTGINGKVLRCTSLQSGKTYALKILEDSPAARREAELHWHVSDCPNVVRIIDVYENNNENTRKKYLLLVMECMEGGELFNRIKLRTSFTESEAAKIVYQIASAIAYLHTRSIVHRDLKPENLLFASAKSDLLKLTDFGFARELVGTNSLKTPCYTPYYAAPEILNKERYDKYCDLWSLGIITYILLCGFPPFFSRSGAPLSPGMQQKIIFGNFDFPPAYWAHVSNGAKDLIRRLLLVEPTRRLSSADVMRHPWIAQHTSVPQTPLVTTRYLASTNWALVTETMNEELQGMRKDADNVPRLVPLDQSRNPLLQKRFARKLDNPMGASK
ncbi:Mitogen-activated protein kinase-activated protein kinase 2 [Paragonimus heterotremus]|uniref:non-specific serine/threonine protein kinase n=1 Tax=Paragonimus heterotremus TaxID=100268 RepID=A0A8J4SSV4_9TREM|nr:Mitogen-activated protein kinase-activated protein kinase 2 [Paragonimus heterotremus]